jgi:hypothetical protein
VTSSDGRFRKYRQYKIDLNEKPVSNATQTALRLEKAPLNSPCFTGQYLGVTSTDGWIRNVGTQYGEYQQTSF